MILGTMVGLFIGRYIPSFRPIFEIEIGPLPRKNGVLERLEALDVAIKGPAE